MNYHFMNAGMAKTRKKRINRHKIADLINFHRKQTENHVAPKFFTHPSIKACRTRTILTEFQAVEIFRINLANEDQKSKGDRGLPAAEVARYFDVSEKAIRDIWNGRTWST
uniref:Uncharacterized protein n=1 Tax=Cryptomonas curvata TaxID=233186 RepID=A0A7S0MMG8_9CRYP|mmetsp:Transcript_45728/g.95817  ORF Transcript_45728/g.95817 Transcript_45728/m.95817 type:complete len:111 (+) Transcript_45728:98-430(+)